MADKRLDGKVAIVTGAGGGMGRVIALALIDAGARVAVLDVRHDGVDETCRLAAALADSEAALPLTADVSVHDSCIGAVRATVDAFNGVDVLVNAAGIGMYSISDTYWTSPVKFWEVDVARFRRLMEVNWTGAFMMAREATPHMLRRKWGRIVNVTTSLDTMYTRGYTPYGPSKAALEAATSCWAKDLKDSGVTANVLVPGGPVNTAFIPERAPFDRRQLIQPEVLGPPAVWLASDASDGVTDMRFVARDWDPSLPIADAVQQSGAPCAWVGAGRGKTAIKPVALS
jgi:NAD(P)-dependent dehydrogenase (short-subunit alcohol dehydrogenase family)